MNEIKVNTVIIGAGISGLSAAHFLSKKSNDFLILESQNQVGGIIQTVRKNDFICENGPNTVLLNNEAIIEILKDCGLWDSINYPQESSNKNRFVLNNNQLITIPTTFLKFVKSPILSTKGKLRILKELFVKKHKENTNVSEFITKRFGKEFHDNLIVPFVSGIYAGDTSKMSVKHTLKILWNLEQTHGSVIKGLFKLKKKNIKSFHLPNGISQLTFKIAEKLNKNLKCNFEVEQIIKKNGFYEITGNKEVVICSNVIATVPAYVLKNIFFEDYLFKELDKVIYSTVDVFHFGFEKKNIENLKEGFGVLTKPSDKKSFLGILFNSRIFNHVSANDKELFTVLIGGERQKDLCQLSKIELRNKVLVELEDIIQHNGNVIFENHYKWEKGIPQYNMNQENLIMAINKFESNHSNLKILGNYFNGVSVSDCIMKSKQYIDSCF